MACIRRFCLSLLMVVGSLFCLLQLGVLAHSNPGNDIVFSLIDFEDSSNSEPSEDKNGENLFKEYKLNKFKSLTSEVLFLTENSKFGELNFDNSLEVFLEVVTPPPEA